MSGKSRIKVFEARRRLVLAVFALAAASLLVRAVYLQVLERGFLRHEAQLRHERVVEVPAYRGMITDRNGEPFAVSAPVDSIWANPAVLMAERRYLDKIARILGLDYDELYSRLAARGDREFVYLKRHVRPAIAERVMQLEAPGVDIQREYRRYYPTGEVTGHVLGFTDIDDRGQEGLELAYDDWLRGEPGRHRIIQDRTGRAVEHVERISDPDPGKDLTLSIDRRLQYLAYRELAAAVQRHDAVSGSAVMLDPFTGEILAMVNQPAFNPNNREDRAGHDFRNRAVTDVFEPGSAIKPFTVAAALESGAYQPASTIDTGPGRLRVSGHAIHDVRDYGVLDLAGILRKSSNVGATKIALSLDPSQLWRMLQGVGLGERTGVGFPGESSGFLAHYARWYPLDQATLGFGYGVSVTALQLARAYGVLAADGLLVRPVLVRAAAHPRPTRVMSMATAHQLLAMLETVVGPEGTAPKAGVRGYRVAGKTGTARKSEAGGYAEDRYVAVFAGIAPASRPRLVMVVVINEPRRNGYYGGEAAAPVFARVMEGALRLLDVSPDDLPALQAATVSGEGRS
jgi:cell division protein FtsI (penicillin-binding protein 3)